MTRMYHILIFVLGTNHASINETSGVGVLGLF
ncbi:hypothetical protein THOM_1613 [Trachipleistophora hominis]|uniref:Uncharacterized protein n=1 Tax=Trachipleistophora hominis TaxID=72359 RepID=L7JVT7_TRAHO|nr:hypothetical protein THOM_1613 [Trachipleistophora hominis]